jgi:hypothetical protein
MRIRLGRPRKLRHFAVVALVLVAVLAILGQYTGGRHHPKSAPAGAAVPLANAPTALPAKPQATPVASPVTSSPAALPPEPVGQAPRPTAGPNVAYRAPAGPAAGAPVGSSAGKGQQDNSLAQEGRQGGSSVGVYMGSTPIDCASDENAKVPGPGLPRHAEAFHFSGLGSVGLSAAVGRAVIYWTDKNGAIQGRPVITSAGGGRYNFPTTATTYAYVMPIQVVPDNTNGLLREGAPCTASP